MASFDEFIKSLRDEFGEQGAGKPFEVFCKWFLENDPEWSKKESDQAVTSSLAAGQARERMWDLHHK